MERSRKGDSPDNCQFGLFMSQCASTRPFLAPSPLRWNAKSCALLSYPLWCCLVLCYTRSWTPGVRVNLSALGRSRMVGTYYRNPKSEREAVKSQQICKFKKTDRQVVGVSVPAVPLVVLPALSLSLSRPFTTHLSYFLEAQLWAKGAAPGKSMTT